MRIPVRLFAVLGLLPCSVFSQSFEVASVRPAPPQDNAVGLVGRTGGPGTSDPTRVRFTNMSLAGLVMNAYGISYFQLSGPQWMNEVRFEVIAALPADTTKEQFRTMLQNLLAERFKLAVHHERKSVRLYSLTIAPGGPKFKEAADAESVPSDADAGRQGAPRPLTRDKDGYPVLAPGTRGAMISGPNGAMYARIRVYGDDAMDFLLSQLSGQLSAPVEDHTGLTGKYSFTLSWIAQSPNALNPDSEEAGPNLITAVQDQLGLKLTPQKGEIEVIVVDHAEKRPREN
jgi:uncharacterized protein (TIGR03435 family)